MDFRLFALDFETWIVIPWSLFDNLLRTFSSRRFVCSSCFWRFLSAFSLVASASRADIIGSPLRIFRFPFGAALWSLIFASLLSLFCCIFSVHCGFFTDVVVVLI